MTSFHGQLLRTTGLSVEVALIKRSGYCFLKKHGLRSMVVTKESKEVQQVKPCLQSLVPQQSTIPIKILNLKKHSGLVSIRLTRRSTLLQRLFLRDKETEPNNRLIKVAWSMLMPTL